MTDLISPPQDPDQELAWARQALRDFPPGSQKVSAKEIRSLALGVLRQHRRQSQRQSRGKLVKLHFVPSPPKSTPPSSLPTTRPAKP